MRVRLGEVAARAGVSVATVSRVLNGRPGVAAVTRQRVLAHAEALGHSRPERVRTALIGLIVPELENPVFPLYVSALESALSASGHTPVLCSTTTAALENDYIDLLLERGVDGLVFVCGRHANLEADRRRYQELRELGTALVCVNGWMPGLDAPFLSADDVQAMQMATGHLLDLGHRRIGCVMGPARYVTTQRKVAGYLAAMADAGLGGDPELVVHSVFSVEGGQVAMQVLLERAVTAVVCGSDLMALGAIRTARDHGLTVPGDISVVGYDDSPMMAFTDPPLTTVQQDVHGISRHAVEALIGEMRGAPQPRRELLFKTQLVVRGSCGPAGHQKRG